MAIFVRGDWSAVKPFQDEFAPQRDELWVINTRTYEHWQSQFDDSRIPYGWQRFPVNFLEINPKYAEERGIESGDWVAVENDNVLTQTGERFLREIRCCGLCERLGVTGCHGQLFSVWRGASGHGCQQRYPRNHRPHQQSVPVQAWQGQSEEDRGV